MGVPNCLVLMILPSDMIFPAQKCATYTAVDAVVVRRGVQTNLIAAGLGHDGVLGVLTGILGSLAGGRRGYNIWVSLIVDFCAFCKRRDIAQVGCMFMLGLIY